MAHLPGLPGQINLPGMVAPQPVNPWQAISSALTQLPQQMQAQQEHKEDRQYLLQQRKAQMEQANAQNAQAKITRINQALLSQPPGQTVDPSSPYFQPLAQAYQEAGLPMPKKADGSYDLDSAKAPWSSLDEKTVTAIMQLPQAQRKVALSRYSGVPQDAFTTDAYISAKDQASLQRALTGKTSEEDRTRIQDSRTKIMQDRTNAYDSGQYAKVAEIDANTAKLKADVTKITEETREMPIKLQQAQQRISDALQRTKLIGQRGGQGGFQATRILNTEASATARLFNEADGAYTRALQAYNTALAGNADPDSPEMQAAKQQLDSLQQRRDSLQSSYSDAQNFLSGEASALATGGHLAGMTGNPTTVVSGSTGAKPLGRAPAGVAPGKYTINGKQVEVRADGNYYAI